MEKELLLSVPNISEGRDTQKIDEICSVVERNEVSLLDVKPDENHNRTVITFAGRPWPVVEAAFNLIKKSAELIDMSIHKGEHPRMGAVDVCPFVPVLGLSMEDSVEFAHILGGRVGDNLRLSGYFYAEAALKPSRKKLPDIRRGQYERLPEKLKDPEWEPDFGPAEFNPKFGCVAVGARDFLVAYNINLDIANILFAKYVTAHVRRIGNTVQAKAVDATDKGYVQVSMNLTDYRVISIPAIFSIVEAIADEWEVKILNSEIIGLIPCAALAGVSHYHVKAFDFEPEKQIIEEVLSL